MKDFLPRFIKIFPILASVLVAVGVYFVAIDNIKHNSNKINKLSVLTENTKVMIVDVKATQKEQINSLKHTQEKQSKDISYIEKTYLPISNFQKYSSSLGKVIHSDHNQLINIINDNDKFNAHERDELWRVISK